MDTFDGLIIMVLITGLTFLTIGATVSYEHTQIVKHGFAHWVVETNGDTRFEWDTEDYYLNHLTNDNAQ